jgi:hypothetical protein
MAPEFLNAEIGALLARIGHSDAGFDCALLASGGNNRVLLVSAGSDRFIAKCYFREQGARDRMRTEFQFLQHARNNGLDCVPAPLTFDSASDVALYEFIDGRRLQAGELGVESVSQAAKFFAALNTDESRAAGRHLPNASDASFSIAETVESVDRRIERLSSIPCKTAADREGAAFIGQIAATWARMRNQILRTAAHPEEVIPDQWRCLSPSDFGFHNALVRPSGEVCFLDFEYAGWDDPAKMAGDFFAHPGLPVPHEHFEGFLAKALTPFRDCRVLADRARGLRALAGMRWCCIVLNEFLPGIAQRRQFADPALDLEARKLQQLGKARQLFRQQEL